MTTEAERIEARELDGLAWSFRDMLQRAAMDEQPSTAARALLDRVRDRATGAARAAIDAHGFAVFTRLDPTRAGIWEAVQIVSDDLARSSLAELATPQAGRAGRQRGSGAFLATELPARIKRACTGLKSAIAGRSERRRSWEYGLSEILRDMP